MRDALRKFLLACPGFQALCRLLTRRHVRAVMYHRFSERATGDPRKVDLTTLERQTRLIARHHDAWDPDRHLQADALGSWPGGRCPVVVTVDDGYRDFATVAHVVFRARRIPVMVFVTTGFVDGTTWFWWDKLEYALQAAGSSRIELALDGESLTVDLRSLESRQRAWSRIADRGRFRPDAAKEQLVAEVARQLGVALPAAAPAEYAPLSWDEIRRLATEGVLFGAHTVRHPILSRVAPDDAGREIADSQATLATRLALPVDWFCYPQGGPADWTPEVRAAVAERFAGGYLAYRDWGRRGDPYTLPRYCVTPDWTAFRWMLCGAEYLVLRLRRFLGMETTVGASYWEGAEAEQSAAGDTTAAVLAPEKDVS
jgi:peptidoglycan/xylan/chitin deacetylase (PgdA/CDA1 family)